MKRTLFVMAGWLAVPIFLVSSIAWAKLGGADVFEAAQQQARFEISKGGALTYVRTREGKEIKSLNEGYSIAYQLADQKKGKMIGKPKVVYTIGNSFPCNHLECETCQRLQKSTQAVASAITTDGALMITSSFELDPQTSQLKVARVIENISNDPKYSQPVKVKLFSAQVQYDPQLASGISSQTGLASKTGKGEKLEGIKANRMFSNFVNPASPAGMMFLSACEFCPPNCDISLNLSPGERGTICIDCPGEKDPTKTVVQYMRGLVPGGPSCNHPITIEEWGEFGVPEGEKKIICAKCDSAGFSTKVFQSNGLTDAMIKEREQCTVAVTVKRGETKMAMLEQRPDSDLLVLPGYRGQSRAFLTQVRKIQPRTGVLPLSELAPGQRIGMLTVYSLK